MSIYLHEVEANAQSRYAAPPQRETVAVVAVKSDESAVVADERESDAEQCN